MNRLFPLTLAALLGFLAPVLRADVIDDYGALRTQLEEAKLDACAGQANPAGWTALREAAQKLAPAVSGPAGREWWTQVLAEINGAAGGTPDEQARVCGAVAAQMQYLSSLELLWQQEHNNLPAAQAWRALIDLPKHANAIEGALALQSQLANASQIKPITELLARECLEWQTQRIREKTGNLLRLINSGQYNRALLELRFSEIATLANFPHELYREANAPAPADTAPTDFAPVIAAALPQPGAALPELFHAWREGIEDRLPSFLSPQEVARHERLLLKLVKLVPKEYGSGVRDGQITVPLEYREAAMFIVQAQQLADELSPVWVHTRADAQRQYHEQLTVSLTSIEKLIAQKASVDDVTSEADKAEALLENKFSLSLRRSGDAATALEETVLDIRTSLKNSLAAAQAGNWSQAESHRLDAYTTFDSEIEKRVLPRDYALGIKTERSFLDGQDGKGIKAALDARLHGAELEAVYQQVLDNVHECQSLLKVGLSPATIMFTTVSIIAREGLEAVVILAALLAGLRGEENRYTRTWIVRGAGLALVASGLTFWLSRTLIESLSRYGEIIEAIVSVLAVIVLLIVTNWVFHKYYWADWNSKLRSLTKGAANQEQTGRWQWLALVSVGFMTIYREGFEVSLFMQSLLMEGSHQAVTAGVLVSVLLIGTIGTLILYFGAKLPIRKMLVITGLFIVSILFTFLGATVRLFQTVGWLTIHPIPHVEIPTWMGQWLGLYPSWEGVIIPVLGLSYVGGAWLFMKLTASREQTLPPKTSVSSAPQTREKVLV
jgi:high-affinity iron transporter